MKESGAVHGSNLTVGTVRTDGVEMDYARFGTGGL